MNKYLILIGFVLILFSSLVLAYNYNIKEISNEQLTVFEFDDSEWNYVVGLGFVTDKGVEILRQDDFTKRSRDYFLGEIK